MDQPAAAPAASGQAAQGQGGGGGLAAACGGGGGIQSLVFMLLMFGVMWFILIRPQQKKAREHANMLNQLKKGDEVVTRGGILGRVTGVQDNIVTIEVQEKVRMRVMKSYVEGLNTAGAGAAAAKSAAQPTDAGAKTT